MVKAAFQRLALITGEKVIERLANIRVLVFGLGGVGSWAAEALVRSGVGNIGVVDYDRICVTNLNRQCEALMSTLGKLKTAALSDRLLDINGECGVEAWETVYSRDTASLFNFEKADYVIDAIDSVSCKLDLIEAAAASGAVLFSSMGMAGKLDPLQIRAADIWETEGCPLARLVRQRLRKRGFDGHFTAVFSAERLPRRSEVTLSVDEPPGAKKVINGSAVTVTAAAGMALASLVLQDVLHREAARG